MKKSVLIVIIIILILLLFFIFRKDIGFSPKDSGKLKNIDRPNYLSEFSGSPIKNPSSQEAKSLFSKFIANGNE